MGVRYRHQINRDTRRPPIGEKREEKAEQWKRLELYAFSKIDEGRVALLARAKAHPYEDLSPFFAEVEALAKAATSAPNLRSAFEEIGRIARVYAHIICKTCGEYRPSATGTCACFAGWPTPQTKLSGLKLNWGEPSQLPKARAAFEVIGKWAPWCCYKCGVYQDAFSPCACGLHRTMGSCRRLAKQTGAEDAYSRMWARIHCGAG